MSENTGAMNPPICEHHWVFSHQKDFPEGIYWVGVCSACGNVNGAVLADSVAAIESRVREQVAREIKAERKRLLGTHRTTTQVKRVTPGLKAAEDIARGPKL